MNRYPLWKNLLLVVVVLFGLIYSLPNVFDQDPAIEIKGDRRASVDTALESRIQDTLKSANLEVKSSDSGENRLLLRFPDSENASYARKRLLTPS